MSDYTHIFFDLDGTLTDPGVGITNSVAYALERYGIRVPDRQALYPFIGPPLVESFRRFYGFSPADARAAVDVYREYYADRGIFENRVYPGIPALLERLGGAGHGHQQAGALRAAHRGAFRPGEALFLHRRRHHGRNARA